MAPPIAHRRYLLALPDRCLHRAAIVYVELLVSMRAIGKRIAAQLGIGELAVILMLAAAISAPIQMPKKGLLSAVVILGTVPALQPAYPCGRSAAARSSWQSMATSGSWSATVACNEPPAGDTMSRDVVLC